MENSLCLLHPSPSLYKIMILLVLFAKTLANVTSWQEDRNEWKMKVRLARRIKSLSLEVDFVTFITDDYKHKDKNTNEKIIPEENSLSNGSMHKLNEHTYSPHHNNEVMACGRNNTQFLSTCDPKNKHLMKSLIGVDIRVTTIYNPPLTMLEKKGSRAVLTGYIGDVWHDIRDVLKFSYTIYTPKDGTFGNLLKVNCQTRGQNIVNASETCQKWSGMIGQVVRGEVDVIVTPLTMTGDRLASLHFSSPLIRTSEGLFIRLNWRPTPSYIFYLQPFSGSLWFLFGLIVLVLLPVAHALLCWFVPRCNDLSRNSEMSEKDSAERHVCDKDMASVFHWLSESLGIFCQQGLQYVPHSMGVRVTLVVTLISSNVVYNVYSGSLASFLTVERQINLPFNTLQDLLHSDPKSGFSIGILSNSSLTTILSGQKSGVYKDAWDKIVSTSGIIPTRLEGFRRACAGKFAFFTMKASYEGYRRELLPCELYDIPESNFNSYMGLSTSKGYCYAPLIDDIILKMMEAGLLNRQRLRWWSRYRLKDHAHEGVQKESAEADASDPVMKISIEHVEFAFDLLFVGCALSLIILAFEKMSVWHACDTPFQFT